MNLGQTPQKIPGEIFRWILRPTLQVNPSVKANPWN